MKNQLKGILGLSLSMMTGTLITLFLSGKIIAIPRGTHEAGIIGASGVAVILVSMGILSFVITKIFPSNDAKSH